MYVVTLVTQKGGSDKSTFTVGLAVAAMEDANGVAVIPSLRLCSRRRSTMAPGLSSRRHRWDE